MGLRVVNLLSFNFLEEGYLHSDKKYLYRGTSLWLIFTKISKGENEEELFPF